MIRKICLLALLLQCTTGAAAESNMLFSPKEQSAHIFVNNRILAKVNGTAISVVDVMKKLDMQFYRQFPQYASMVEARYQYYQMNWKFALKEMIERELIIADAKESKQEVSNGDIRQEMETYFGPNIIANLEKAGLTYDEAWEMMKEDLTMQRMINGRVTSKAIRTVTPKDIRIAYEAYVKENPLLGSWRYQVISIRGPDQTACAEAANYAYSQLTEEGLTISELGPKLETHSLLGDKAKFTISEEFLLTEKEIADGHKEVLASLEAGTYSRPQAQQSRVENSKVFRIFYLKEMTAGGNPPFHEVEHPLKNKLIEKAIGSETEKYIIKLKVHYDRQNNEPGQMYPENFQPFALR